MPNPPGKTAIEEQGWLKANRWLLMRRVSQLGVLGLFLLGPLFGVWLVTGNLSSSMTLGILPLTDPLLLAQSILSGTWPALTGIVGALLVLLFYALSGGRVFCAWVCPVNLVTDLAAWGRRRFDIRASGKPSRDLRWWLLGLVLLFPLVTGVMAWEYVNPVSILHRGLIFGGLWGLGWAWVVVLAVFLYDLFIVRRGWCGHLCPVGACYAAIGAKAPVRIATYGRDRCDDCMDCFEICPEPHVIKPALKGAARGLAPLITSIDCTKCGRCIDVCSKDVFSLALGRGAGGGAGSTGVVAPSAGGSRPTALAKESGTMVD